MRKVELILLLWGVVVFVLGIAVNERVVIAIWFPGASPAELALLLRWMLRVLNIALVLWAFATIGWRSRAIVQKLNLLVFSLLLIAPLCAELSLRLSFVFKDARRGTRAFMQIGAAMTIIGSCTIGGLESGSPRRIGYILCLAGRRFPPPRTTRLGWNQPRRIGSRATGARRSSSTATHTWVALVHHPTRFPITWIARSLLQTCSTPEIPSRISTFQRASTTI